jgi:hypothetical protein
MVQTPKVKSAVDMVPIKHVLTAGEESELEHLEQVIDRGMATFVEVGRALLTIRDRRLYRSSHETFEGYCLERWGFTRTYAHRLISATEVVSNVANLATNPNPPSRESHARPLVGLPAARQQQVWTQANREAQEEGARVTAARIEEILRRAAPARVPSEREQIEKEEKKVLAQDRRDRELDAWEDGCRWLRKAIAAFQEAGRRAVPVVAHLQQTPKVG